MNNLGIIIGSLRKESFNRQVVNALLKLNHPNLKLSILKIEDIPLYNQDLDTDLPASVIRIKKEIAAADAILFATPEYNRSVPGVLKNVIDWGTRPYGKNVWQNKPIAMMGVSIGKVGTAVAQAHLKSIMSSIGAVVLGFPEIYLQFNEDMLDKDKFKDVATKDFLQGFLDTLSQWVKDCQAKG